MHYFEMNNWNMHGMGWIFWIILLGVVIWFIYYTSSQISQKDTPLDILKKRYARGEIDKEEYEEKRNVIVNKKLTH